CARGGYYGREFDYW
nr:immunoglobulin heavy chain junction region [Mus musculus]